MPTIAIDRRELLPGIPLALLLGLLVGARPELAIALMGGGLVLALAFAAPAALLTAVLLAAAILPYDLQNRYGLGMGGSAGLVLTDVLLLAGLAWAAIALVGMVRERQSTRGILLLLAFFCVCSLQLLHGLWLGRDVGTVGYEFRNLLGLAVAFIAIPLLLDDEQRPRVLRGLVVVGLLLGLWGNLQWILTLPPSVSEDFGVREGVAFTTSGLGQVLGGRYAFPAAVVLSFTALLAGGRKSPPVVALLLGVFVLNAVALVLTYERAFWAATVLAMLLVVVGAGHVQRLRAIVWGGMAVIVTAAAFSAIAPGQATAVRERLLSIGQYQSDTSVDYRFIESRAVIRQIHEAEILGSGLGASIYWGRPSEGVAPTTETYSHNAYLRTLWKLGAVGLLLLLAVLAAALLGRRASGDLRLLDTGARAGLLALMIMGATGPVFDTINASAAIGLLIALAVALPAVSARAAGRATAPAAAPTT